MSQREHRLWTDDVDEALVERMITAMQRAIGVAIQDRAHGTGEIQLPAPDLATALLTMLATIVEPSPECGTPSGMRRTAEAVGRELHLLMRDARRLKLADAVEPGKVS